MNEQQLADIFSEQLDLLLQEQPVNLPAEAVELRELFGLGQQFTQLQFQPSAAAQAAFQGQLATWFTPGSGIPSASTWLGIPKNLVAIMLIAGGGLGLAAIIGMTALLAGNDSPATAPAPTAPHTPAKEHPTILPKVLPAGSPTRDEVGEKSQQSSDQLPVKGPDNSTSDTINAHKPVSVGDTLPTQQPAISSTATITPTNTPGVATNPANGEGDNPSDSSADPGTGDNPTDRIDNDRGHGNDPGGYDPDNPGNSTGVGGGQDNAPNLGRGNESSGSSSSGGNSNSSNSNNGNSGGNSNDKGKGKDK